MGAGPGGGDAQPAAGFVVGLAFAVPVELHFDAAVLVAVDLFTFGAGDHGALAAEDARFFLGQRWAIRHVPRRGLEAVAVALVEIVFQVSGVAGDRLFQHLRLFAFVEDFGQQPQIVPFGFRVLGQGQEVAADQQRLIAFTFGELEVTAVAFEGAFGQVLAAFAVDEATGIVVVFEVGQGVATVFAFQRQARFFEVVVAAGGAAGAGFQAQVEALDHRVVGDHAGVLLVGHGREFREHRLVIAEHQLVGGGAVLKVVVDTFFLAQTLNELQVRFIVLNAVNALGINRPDFEFVGIALNAVLFEDAADDFRHVKVLEDALVDAVRQVRQLRAQGHRVAGQAFAGIALGGAVDLAMDAAAVRRELQEGGFVQQGLEVQGRLFTDQLHLKHKRLADGFPTLRGENLEVAGKTFDGQCKVSLIGRREHPLFLVQCCGVRQYRKRNQQTQNSGRAKTTSTSRAGRCVKRSAAIKRLADASHRNPKYRILRGSR